MRSVLIATALIISSMAGAASAQLGMTRPAVSPAAAGTAPAQSTPGAAAVSGSLGAVDPHAYKLAPQDNIEITVYKEPTMSGAFPVRPDGMISLPLIGDVIAAGLTPMELSTSIGARLSKFVQSPNVTVAVLSVQPKEIFLLGEVMHVGPVLLLPGMTPLQAISAAGGPTPFANTRKSYILRTVDGKQLKLPFDYKKAMKLGDQQGLTLQPGDTVVMP